MNLFLRTARAGSFRAASEGLGLDLNALRRRVADLERRVGRPLLTRYVGGVRLTSDGERLLAHAARMEQAAFEFLRSAQEEPAVAGSVRVAVTEGLGTFWLAPELVELQRAYPKLFVTFSCGMRAADTRRLEADVAVQIERPTAGDVRVARLGRLHVCPFASADYASIYGLPTSVEELRSHRLVLQVADQTAGDDLFAQVFPDADKPGFVAFETNTSSSNYSAVASGMGIGWLPSYIAVLGSALVPVEVDLRFAFDIWLTYHPDVERNPRVRTVIDWIKGAFDARRHPYFGDAFLHPSQIARRARLAPMVALLG